MLALEARPTNATTSTAVLGLAQPGTDLFGLDHAGQPAVGNSDLGTADTGSLLAGGILSSLIGGAFATLVFAWAFHVRDPRKPKWTPALVVGGSAAGMGILRTIVAATR